MKFSTAYNHTSSKPCPSGSRYRTIFKKQLSSEGQWKLIENGKEDVYDSIQKAAQGLTLEDLIRRARAGDTTAIGEPLDSFADLTHIPTDLLDAHAMLQDAKDKYLRLPSDLRAKYGNSFEKFLQAASDGSLVSSMIQPNKVEAAAPSLTPEEITKVRDMLGGNNNA